MSRLGAEDPPLAGTVVAGRWEIVRALGRGAFGHTVLARDRESGREGGRDVAIKVLDPRGTDEWKARELFEREAAVLRSLRHHGIPEVHELARGEWRGAPAAFLVMEFVEGRSLAELIDEGRTLDAPATVELFLEMLGILEYLHGRVPPVLHRDIKPANIVLRPNGLPALVDFGSVRHVFLGAEEMGSTVAGTYGYMPYEQYMGQATPSSDLYALGATFLHLLTGRAPREFMTGEGRLEVPPALPGDPRLRPILARLLNPSPADRFASAAEVRRALLAPPGEWQTGAATAVARVGAPPVPHALTPSARAALDTLMAPAALAAPIPRPIAGDTKALLERAAPSMWELLDSSRKRGDGWGFVDVVTIAFYSVITAGVLPAVVYGVARSRRRRLERFFRRGTPTTAEVLGTRMEEFAFGEKFARVSYEFEADGHVHRDSDVVLPVLADRWRVGERVPVLYIPEEGYESVIVTVR